MLLLELGVKSSDVRDNFSEFVDSVIHKAPKVVSRRRDNFLAVNVIHLSALVEGVQLHANIEFDDDGSYIASSKEIDDIFVRGNTEEEALFLLAQDLIQYSLDYLSDDFPMYFNAPNRRGHFKYVVKIMLCNTIDEVVSSIHAESQGT